MRNKLERIVKIGLIFFGINFIFFSCDNNENSELIFEHSFETNPQNVSFDEARSFYFDKQKELALLNKASKSSKTNLELIPDWNSLSQDSIFYSSALLTKADVEINRNGIYSSYLYFVKKK